MKPRQEFTPSCFPGPCWATTPSWDLVLRVYALAVLAVTCLGCGDASGNLGPEIQSKADLPEISAFLTKPSDRFLVDIKEISRGHPFLGADSPRPHAGGHVHFDNTGNHWPTGKDEPASYPAIYAVADGVVSRIDTHFANGANDRYGLDLTIAKDETGSACRFCYSIEPMVPEPSEGFYKKFILVRKGQQVRKGELIAYLYTPPNVDGCHIHFHLMVDGRSGFLAPAIFDSRIVKDFHDKCDGFRWSNGGKAIPPCMGYRIAAKENPFGTGAKEQL